ncbi:M56 family metallopeptidase [uncultured Flavonifractor sp.]|uniref:M56 family metallopeptidase n=1 Tax=uncultured Flavonifractor sp. TaxID=1193534 RepID=UPI002607FB07|nr:M56 family metallopeptidase [uncultured Flavonifractor sp.]
MTELFLEVADRAVAAGWLILAVLLRDNIYQSEYVTSPFVLGLIRPKIYLPFSLGADTMGHVLAHEQAHIARRDHWWKPLGFALTAVYWFQPLMWVAYLLFCRDIELACDQRVVRTMDPMGRANYSQALLDCSTGRRPPGACPLAFGEAGVKIRVRAALHYKKPGFWVVLVAVLLCAGAAATAHYVWQELGTTDAAATDPWSSMDCVLAYDWSVMPCFVQLTLQTGVLDAAGLTALAESLTLTAG